MGALNPYAKAVIAGLVAGCTAVTTTALDGHLSIVDGALILAATLTGFLATWATTNSPAA